MGRSAAAVVVVAEVGVDAVVVDAVAVGEAEQGEEQQNDRASREGTDCRDTQHRQLAVGVPGLFLIFWGSPPLFFFLCCNPTHLNGRLCTLSESPGQRAPTAEAFSGEEGRG